MGFQSFDGSAVCETLLRSKADAPPLSEDQPPNGEHNNHGGRANSLHKKACGADVASMTTAGEDHYNCARSSYKDVAIPAIMVITQECEVRR